MIVHISEVQISNAGKMDSIPIIVYLEKRVLWMILARIIPLRTEELHCTSSGLCL